MEMIVLRRVEGGADEVVGRVRVSRASDTDSRAIITRSTRGVQPQDRVRAVYELPSDTSGADTRAPRTDTKKKIASGTKLLLGLIALIGLATIFKGGGDKGEEVPNATAAAFASPAEFGSIFDQGGILIAWNTPKEVRTGEIIEYHVWRDNHGTYFGSTGGSNVAGPVLAPDQTSAAQISCPLGSFDHHAVDDIAYRVPIEWVAPSRDHTDLEDGSASSMPGITPGKLHNYWVSCVYLRKTFKSAEEEGEDTYWETSPVPAGRATYLQQRPVCRFPGDVSGTQYVDLGDVRFEWEGCRSANEYVIEVSTSPQFKRDETWCKKVYQSTAQDGMLIQKDFVNELSTGSELQNVQPGDSLFWRIGARNNQDNPGPYPAGPTPCLEGEKNTRYIYSDPNEQFMFMKLETPSEPPSDGGDDGGDDDDNPPGPPLES
jgi:hypothetical protein